VSLQTMINPSPARQDVREPDVRKSNRRLSRGDTTDQGQLVTHILSVSACRDDHKLLRGILNDHSWHVDEVHTCHEAVVHLCKERMPVIICDSDLPDGTWKDMLSHIAALNEAPLLIVTSRLADEALWAEVLNLGGFDVLAKPFYHDEVNHVLESARQRWIPGTAVAGSAIAGSV
jgi:DNA-binding response OmpR family regulator